MLAPAGTLERRYVLAQALRLLCPGGALTALAHKTLGGARLGSELEAFGCEVHERAKAHHRICHCVRPAALVGVDAAIAEGELQRQPELGLWTQPGLFSWNRIDPGSALLSTSGEPLVGAGVDLGCGYGFLSLAALKSPAVTDLLLVDVDSRAILAARRNIEDPRARFLQADGRGAFAEAKSLDFALVNPPFHSGGHEDRNLGRDLVLAAAAALRKGGVCRIVANTALPYEAAMAPAFTSVKQIARSGGFKVIEGRR